MKPVVLHAVPFACSLAVHLELARYGVPHQVVWHPRGPGRRIVDSLTGLNVNRRVPTLELGDGTVLTEMVAVLHHLDRRYGVGDAGSLEDLSFVATELHAPILTVLFDTEAPEACKHDVRTRLLPATLDVLEQRLRHRPFAGGAAAYLSWALMLLDVAVKGLVVGHATSTARAAASGEAADRVLALEHAARAAAERARSTD